MKYGAAGVIVNRKVIMELWRKIMKNLKNLLNAERLYQV